jgi:hypothetical protein
MAMTIAVLLGRTVEELPALIRAIAIVEREYNGPGRYAMGRPNDLHAT